ncbi:MAG TPA: proline--tRNA ligase [Nitrospirae bacterium]|nr:proline--tRNA ligase [bacterium BMS3Abin10]GBE40033.1 proline--tRNA ligase [bacterium BMS3Bbin08]HDH51368.1 proline--tRNA ligase [Nitrospirota bacterium]HDK41116.1 proline--tRNA ligase [Nitrospirota bacterium]HDK81358.1 proline--tRNA ligase [Nitrospirota bacterium]
MRFSNMFIPTLRESPAEAEAASHILMLRAGYIRQLAAGLYIYLPLAWRVIGRVNRIIKQEMDAIGAQEISMPAIHPAEIWQKTGRWSEVGEEMFRLRDRGQRDMCLGMTHEEIVTWLASAEIRSYRDLPQTWYQIQTKFRDEARPRSGILRTREFLMKDSYSFDKDEQGLEENYKKHAEAYHRIFSRCGLKFYQVESDPGMMGGATAHEFMAPSPAGEDSIALCAKCGYSANTELAVSVARPQPAESKLQGEPQDIETPEKRTVSEVSEFLGMDTSFFIKSLLMIGEKGPFLALVRGDQELHEKKLHRIAGECRPAQKEEIKDIIGVEAGFIGPVGTKLKMIADPSLKDGVYVSGANRPGFHTKGIKPGVHFKAEWHDIHTAKPGDKCPECGSDIKIESAIEIGNIFKLGTKYSRPLKAVYLDENGKEKPIIMGSYGIGPARIAAAAIEQNNDKDGMIWPRSIAPFDVEIIPLGTDNTEVSSVAESFYNDLSSSGLDVLMDDRNVRPGIKFKDADLIGIPWQIVVGDRNLKDGLVEIKSRKTKETQKTAVKEVVEKLRALIAG